MLISRSREGAWIEICPEISKQGIYNVAPARERGLKYFLCWYVLTCSVRRSREGAWIEIVLIGMQRWMRGVAPARERGLK